MKIIIIKTMMKLMLIIITMNMTNNKTMYMKCKIDVKDMLLNKPSYELLNKQ